MGNLARSGLTVHEACTGLPREKKEVQSGNPERRQSQISSLTPLLPGSGALGNPMVSLGLSFLICTMGAITVLTSLSCGEDHTNTGFRFGTFEPPHMGDHVTLNSVPAQSPHCLVKL